MVKLLTSKLCWPDPPVVMSNMTSEGSTGSNSDSGKKERLLVTSVGPGREGCRMARPEINQIHILCILHRLSEPFLVKVEFLLPDSDMLWSFTWGNFQSYFRI